MHLTRFGSMAKGVHCTSPGFVVTSTTVSQQLSISSLSWVITRMVLPFRASLLSLSAYAELPSIADGYWKMVDRNPGTGAYTNVSLCVYDGATGAAYLLTMDI